MTKIIKCQQDLDQAAAEAEAVKTGTPMQTIRAWRLGAVAILNRIGIAGPREARRIADRWCVAKVA